MLFTEIVLSKRLFFYGMHSACGVCSCAHLVSIHLFPPIQRCCYIHPDRYHAEEFPVGSSSLEQLLHEFQIIGSHIKPVLPPKVTVRFIPACIRVSHAAYRRPECFLRVFNAFDLYHFLTTFQLEYCVRDSNSSLLSEQLSSDTHSCVLCIRSSSCSNSHHRCTYLYLFVIYRALSFLFAPPFNIL